ncbi:pentatricopeptide repeat-containing protein [Panicum miliaceum]|uniref:Pentatricopeptide repeat-containing protein n=1 Tax=Panicum miliaceum TaxID=4540 RepID=A0A3L6TA39_PANMI|nr:pentatricopeptide repeat-containing protein [Panicum miliaceum]
MSVFQGMPVKDVISWTGLLNGYMEFGLVDMALDVFDRMPQRNFITYNAVITGFCQNKEGVRVTFAKKAGLRGLGLFRQIVEDGLEISDVTVTGALNACAIAADRKMFRSSGVGFIDEFMLTAALGVCGALGFAELGKQMHSFAAKSGLLYACGVGNAILSMYGKCGELDDAVSFFERMTCRDLVSWNAMVTAHFLHRQGEEILDIWGQMERLDIRPDSITFLLVISACSHTSSDSTDQCRELFLSMSSKYGTEPAMEHYAAFVNVLGCWGHFGEAEQLIGSMPFKPGALVWRSLLDSCSKCSNTTVRRRAMKHLLALEPHDPSTYVLTSNLFSESARWHSSENTRLEMREKGMRKIPARSWTFHENTVHSFFARDRSHPQSKDIYAGLDVLILEHMISLKPGGHARIQSRPARQLARAATVPPGQVSADAAAGDEPRRRESLHERTRLIIGPAGELPRANQMPPLYVLTLRVPVGLPARRPSSSAPAGTSTSSTKAAAAHRSYEPPRPRRPVGVVSGRSSSSASESLHASSLLSRVGMAAGEARRLVARLLPIGDEQLPV